MDLGRGFSSFLNPFFYLQDHQQRQQVSNQAYGQCTPQMKDPQ